MHLRGIAPLFRDFSHERSGLSSRSLGPTSFRQTRRHREISKRRKSGAANSLRTRANLQLRTFAAIIAVAPDFRCFYAPHFRCAAACSRPLLAPLFQGRYSTSPPKSLSSGSRCRSACPPRRTARHACSSGRSCVARGRTRGRRGWYGQRQDGPDMP